MDDPTEITGTPSLLTETQFQSTTIGFRDGVTGNPPRELTTKLLCAVCPKPGDLRCSVCGLRYCSLHCQQLDRSTHKFFCKSLDQFTNDKRPSPHHIRAILFPEDKKNPEWTWILRSEDRVSFNVSHLHENLPTDVLSTVQTKMYRDKRTGRMSLMQHWLMKFTLSQSNRGIHHCTSVNKSALNLGPPGHLQTYWGPILVIAGKQRPHSFGHQGGVLFLIEDLEMVDVWQVFQEMLYGDDKTPCVVNVPRYNFNTLPALKINCFGDRVRFHPDKNPNSNAAIFEAVTVPNREIRSETEQWPSLLAFMLGLPWLCRLVHNSRDLWELDPDGRYKPDPVAVANNELGLFHISLKRCDPEQQQPDTQGPSAFQPPCIAAHLMPHYGSLILVHMYGQRIRPEHVKLANLFAEEKGFAGFRRQEMLWSSGINVTEFKRYWNEKKRTNDVPGVDLRGVPSPFVGSEDQLRAPTDSIKNPSEYVSLFFDTAATILGGPEDGAARVAEGFSELSLSPS